MTKRQISRLEDKRTELIYSLGELKDEEKTLRNTFPDADQAKEPLFLDCANKIIDNTLELNSCSQIIRSKKKRSKT